jgi:DNA-binding CsgD family transcriptional regulator
MGKYNPAPAVMSFSDYPLLERDRELTDIERALAKGVDGDGLCLMIEGPPGVGKTRMLESARSLAQDEGYRVLAARSGEREREYSWGVVRNLFEPIVISADPDELDELFAGPAAACRSLIEGTAMVTEGTPDSSFAIFNGLYALTRRLSDREPLLIAIDDLHWVDGSSLGFLEFLSRRLAAMPVILAATLRPNEPGTDVALIASLSAEPHALVLRPQPLSEKASATALRSRLGDDTAAGVVREGHEVTGGNPLLLSELARTLELEGRGGKTTQLAGNLAALGSRAVARTVEVRVARAGEAGRRLAEAAAVVGEQAQLSRAIELAGLEQGEADEAALDLVRLEVLKPGTRVQFVHPVVRAAIYDGLAAPERMRLHREAIEIMQRVSAPATLIANHLLRVDPEGREETVAILREAAVMAAAGGDARSASVLMQRALEEPPPDDQLTGVLAQLGAAEILIDGPRAIEHLGQAIELVHEPPFKAALAELLARSLILQERIPEAVAVTEATLAEIPEEATDLRRRVEATLVEATLVHPWELSAEQVARSEALLASATTEGDDYGSRAMLSLAAVSASRDLSSTMEETVERARIAAQGSVLIREGVNSITQLGPAQVLTLAGHSHEAISLLNESLRWDERFGSMAGHLANLIFRGLAHLYTGDLEDAAEDTAESLRMSRAYRMGPGVAWSSWIRARALLEMGRVEEARGLMTADYPLDAESPEGWHWTNFTLTRARLMLHDGDAEAALAETRRAAAMYEKAGGVGSTWLSWRPFACDVLLALGRSAEAKELAATELELTRRWGAARQVGAALRALAAADEDRREELLTEAVEELEGSEARLELAGALVDLGAELRRRNFKSRARDPLKQGMDLAHDCGAEPLAERARTELRASGIRARRTALSGPESLTDSERRVADLAVEGKTNREIAAELFVTVKTVEVHLSNAYRKLGIQGRRQLGQAIGVA